jgi:hypothetical protein
MSAAAAGIMKAPKTHPERKRFFTPTSMLQADVHITILATGLLRFGNKKEI